MGIALLDEQVVAQAGVVEPQGAKQGVDALRELECDEGQNGWGGLFVAGVDWGVERATMGRGQDVSAPQRGDREPAARCAFCGRIIALQCSGVPPRSG